ncbi:hypothetical protein DesfrDRAFT_2359 [Solidesulfovibrio fructosivorans JJ]]|uniref:AlgX/AlgJ SGNH hydrolase-like domain-containing protein n=1 Tax=Solidesulfovibrio fructosivorans JJ] TaxID=596151 RepID=E1JXL0_SOLFR|nr:hypothetical protein [Solidesulfovibrio fructosivorans]EFL50987.1 hypothetical protein DesfrDRAFT_2359 [Solidesulfovibrio fructosivorans JJ]]
MKRFLRIGGIVLLVAVQVLLACYIVDFVFRDYEKEHVYSYASKDAPEYSLKKMLLNDVHGVVAKRKPAGEYRILVFGDSYTYAVTKPEYGFCAVLEKKLNAMGLGRTFRVVNLGFPSISFPDYLERFAFWTQALDYDAIIFNVYFGNDFNDVRNTPYDPAAFAARLADACRHGMAYGPYTLVPHQYPFRFMDFVKAQVLFKLQSDKALRRMLFLPDLDALGVMPDKQDPRYSSLLPLTPDQMASEMRSSMKPFYKDTMFAYKNDLPWYALFLATAAKVAGTGKPVMVMLSPPECAVSRPVGDKAARDLGEDPAKADFGLPTRITRELARRVGLPQDDIYDLTPCLAGDTPGGKRTYTGRDTHWSPEGNAWVAELLARRVASRWFGRETEPAACPQKTSAFEPIPAGELPPTDKIEGLAASIVAGCPR